nr:protein O-glucosyltransferase 1 [Ipomoea batatas]
MSGSERGELCPPRGGTECSAPPPLVKKMECKAVAPDYDRLKMHRHSSLHENGDFSGKTPTRSPPSSLATSSSWPSSPSPPPPLRAPGRAKHHPHPDIQEKSTGIGVRKAAGFRASSTSSAQEVCLDSVLCFADEKQREFLERTTAFPSPTPPCTLPPPDMKLLKKAMK